MQCCVNLICGNANLDVAKSGGMYWPDIILTRIGQRRGLCVNLVRGNAEMNVAISRGMNWPVMPIIGIVQTRLLSISFVLMPSHEIRYVDKHDNFDTLVSSIHAHIPRTRAYICILVVMHL